MNYKTGCILSAIYLSMSGAVYAEITDANPDHFLFSGFLDGSYNYLQQSNTFTSDVYDRVYDLNQNGFTLQQAAGTASYLPKEGLGVLLNGMVGRDSIVSNAYGMGTWTSSPDFGVDVTQAFLRFSHENFSIDAGKFTTLNGAETIAPITDTNFSRAILFGYGGPFTAMGFRATYNANEKLKLNLGLNDGWDTITDFSRGPTLELNSTYVFSPLFSLALTAYYGKQRIVDRTSYGPEGNRTLIDVLATINATEKLAFMVNYDYAWQTQALLADGDIGRALWDGVAGYINYTINDKWRTSIRGEVFEDRQGYRTGVAQAWRELTFTVGYIPLSDKRLELRAEVRRDFSNVNSFLMKNLVDSNDYQQSFAIEALYKFA